MQHVQEYLPIYYTELKRNSSQDILNASRQSSIPDPNTPRDLPILPNPQNADCKMQNPSNNICWIQNTWCKALHRPTCLINGHPVSAQHPDDFLVLSGSRHEHLSRADHNLLVPFSSIAAFLHNKWEEDHTNNCLFGFELVVRSGLPTSLIHQRGVKVDLSSKVAIGIVLWLQRWQHDVFGSLSAHFDG